MFEEIYENLETAEQSISEAYTVLEEQGVTLPAQKNLVNLVDTVEKISTVGGGEFYPPTDVIESLSLTTSYTSDRYKWIILSGRMSRNSGPVGYIKNNGTTKIKAVFAMGQGSSVLTSQIVDINPGAEQYASGNQGFTSYLIAFAPTACLTAKKYNQQYASASMLGGR